MGSPPPRRRHRDRAGAGRRGGLALLRRRPSVAAARAPRVRRAPGGQTTRMAINPKDIIDSVVGVGRSAVATGTELVGRLRGEGDEPAPAAPKTAGTSTTASRTAASRS